MLVLASGSPRRRELLRLIAPEFEAISLDLDEGAIHADTPAALVYKATWPDERICRCTIGTLAQSGEEAGIHSTALVLVGEFLRQGNAHYDRSKLYDPGFTTGFREATR